MNKKPTEILSEEHQNILKVIDALNRECDAIESGKGLDKVFFKKSIDFIRNYADKFHHAKEEDILFKELNKNENMHCNPTEQMLHEHELGRGFVKSMDESLKKNDKAQVVENAREYARLLQDHISKEDNILYPMADEALNQKVQKSILDRFKQAEKKRFSKGTKEKYLSIIKEFGRRKTN